MHTYSVPIYKVGAGIMGYVAKCYLYNKIIIMP